MRQLRFLIMLAALVSLALSTITLAQLRDIDQRRVFRDGIVRVGAPFPDCGDDQDDDEGSDDEASDCPP